MAAWVVTVADTVFGPFDELLTASLFADFLTAEVDPATVRTLQSPTRELLAWRDAMAHEEVA